MHKIYSVLILLLFIYACSNSPTPPPTPVIEETPTTTDIIQTPFTDSIVIDERDSTIYPVVKIGEQIWMAKNMQIELDDSWAYKNNATNIAKYGRLYTQAAAMKACPKGWHLPSHEEWKTLCSIYDTDEADNLEYDAYAALIKGGDSQFNALLGGVNSMKKGFYDLENEGFYWSSSDSDLYKRGHYHYTWFYSETEGDKATNQEMYFTTVYGCTYPPSYGLSCRCIKD